MRSAQQRSAAGTAGRGPGGAPVLRVVRGDATPEEIAALVTVLAARSRAADTTGTGQDAATATGSVWADRWRSLPAPGFHRLRRPGPDAWRRSALPGG